MNINNNPPIVGYTGRLFSKYNNVKSYLCDTLKREKSKKV
nr:MAG TPA: hypothetical protein [Caudoviricetes sp.]